MFWFRMLLIAFTVVSASLAQGRNPHAADHKHPAITITTPTTATTYATTVSPLTVGGTASDNVGVTQVTWTNAAGGSGTATGTTTWSASVPLTLGTNQITVTVHDAAGNTGTDTLTVTLMSQPGPITVDWSYGGSTGDAFQMERCTVGAGGCVLSAPPPCPLATVASIAIGDRSWTDTSVVPADRYCYCMTVVTGGQVGDYSNTMCSP